MIKSVPKVENSASIALSACEAELVATAHGCQETLGILHLIVFFEGQSAKATLSL